MKYSKIVRDKIPDIIREKGETPVTRVANENEYWQKLKEKLQEEVAEFLVAENQEELADILEVLEAVLKYMNWREEDVRALQKANAQTRGRFENRFLLEMDGLPAGHVYARPRVGIGVIVFRDGKVLLGKRKSSHGAGEYAWPGGHLEHMESITDCVRREVQEETGIEIKNIRFLRLLNMKDYAPKHYVHISMVADWASGEPQVLEPQKCEKWDWYTPEQLPVPFFATAIGDLEALKTGKNFWDA